MKDELVKLFFQYEKGTISTYEDTYLTNAVHYLPNYIEILEKNNKRFLDLLEEMPVHIFSYYMFQLLTLPIGSFIYQQESIKKRYEEGTKRYELTNSCRTFLIDEQKLSSVINDCRLLGSNVMLVSLRKGIHKYSHTYDFLVHAADGEMRIIKLMSDYRKIHYKERDESFDRSEEVFLKQIKQFEQNNRLKLLFM